MRIPSSKNVAMRHNRAIVGRTRLPLRTTCQFIDELLESEIWARNFFDDVEIEVNFGELTTSDDGMV